MEQKLKSCDRCSAQPDEPFCKVAREAAESSIIHGSYNPIRRRTCVVFPGLNLALHLSDGTPSASTRELELTLQLGLIDLEGGGKAPVIRIKELPDFGALRLPRSLYKNGQLQISITEKDSTTELAIDADRALSEQSFSAVIDVQRKSVTHPDQWLRPATISLKGEVATQIRSLIDRQFLMMGSDPLSITIEVPVNSGAHLAQDD